MNLYDNNPLYDLDTEEGRTRRARDFYDWENHGYWEHMKELYRPSPRCGKELLAVASNLSQIQLALGEYDVV